MRRLARRLTPRNLDTVRFEDGTAEHLPIADGWGDVVWAIASAHHWDDVEAGVAECRRVLAPTGRLLIVENTAGHHGFTEARFREIAAMIPNATLEQFDAARHHYSVITATC